MIDEKKVIPLLGSTVQLRVLIHMFNTGEDYYNGIASTLNISHGGMARVVEPLIESGMLRERRIGKAMHVVEVNEESPITKELKRSFETLSGLEK